MMDDLTQHEDLQWIYHDLPIPSMINPFVLREDIGKCGSSLWSHQERKSDIFILWTKNMIKIKHVSVYFIHSNTE
jgi:hypothetical protein